MASPERSMLETVKQGIRRSTLPVAIALLLTNAGCGGDNTILNFPPCNEDSQPKSADAIISGQTKIAFPSYATIEDVQIVLGVKGGEFALRLTSPTASAINLHPAEHGMSFIDTRTGRVILIEGTKTHYPPETKLSITATCDQQAKS